MEMKKDEVSPLLPSSSSTKDRDYFEAASQSILDLRTSSTHSLPWFGSPMQKSQIRKELPVVYDANGFDFNPIRGEQKKSSTKECLFRIFLFVVIFIILFFLFCLIIMPKLIDTTQNYHNADQSICDPISLNQADIISIPNGKLFLSWFYESRWNHKLDPLIVYIGDEFPNPSSTVALFTENGPCKLRDSLDLMYNSESWNQYANVLWIDQLPDQSEVENETSSPKLLSYIQDLHSFLKTWMQRNPHFVSNDLYIFGQSTALPSVIGLAHSLYQEKIENSFSPSFKINGYSNQINHLNIVGIGIGNSIQLPFLRYRTMGKWMKQNSLIISKYLNHCLSQCLQKLKSTFESNEAVTYCEDNFFSPVIAKNQVNPSNILKKCTNSSTCDKRPIYLTQFLRSPQVQSLLHIPEKNWLSYDHLQWSSNVSQNTMDSTNKLEVLLNANIKVLVYAGDKDSIGSWISNYLWLKQLNWTHAKEFVEGHFKTLDQIGQYQKVHQLSFVKIANAGSLVSVDQPFAAVEMIRRFILT